MGPCPFPATDWHSPIAGTGSRARDIKAAFRAQHMHDLAAPTRQSELARIGAFFNDRHIDGVAVGGIALPRGPGADGLTAGVGALLFARGVRFADPPGSETVEGVANSEAAARALGEVRNLYACCSSEGADNLLAVLDGRAAIAMDWLSAFAAIDRTRATEGPPASLGYFANPSGGENATVLGGHAIGIATGSDSKRAAVDFLTWFSGDAAQHLWWEVGGLPLHRAIATIPALAAGGSFARTYLETLAGGRSLPQGPRAETMVAAMDGPLRDFVLVGQGSAQEALDAIVAQWTAALN